MWKTKEKTMWISYCQLAPKEREYKMKGVIKEGKVISLPGGVSENDYVEEWNNCIYVRKWRADNGKIYCKRNNRWHLIAKNVRDYYVGCKSRVMPRYFDQYGYAIYETNAKGYYLLDCYTGKKIYHGDFEVDDLSICTGMSKNHEKSCFRLQFKNVRNKRFEIRDSEGKKVFEESSIHFLTEDSFDNLWLFTFIAKEAHGIGAISYFMGECKVIIPDEYDYIRLKGVIKDTSGRYQYPTIEAGKGEQHTLFDINGKVIEA